MLLTATQLEQYRRDGFLILPGLFSAAEVQVLKDDLPRLHAEDPYFAASREISAM